MEGVFQWTLFWIVDPTCAKTEINSHTEERIDCVIEAERNKENHLQTNCEQYPHCTTNENPPAKCKKKKKN